MYSRLSLTAEPTVSHRRGALVQKGEVTGLRGEPRSRKVASWGSVKIVLKILNFAVQKQAPWSKKFDG